MIPERLSDNFYRRRFRCHGENCCAHTASVDPRLITLLQEIRDHFGEPIYINRGFSCIAYNRVINGSPNSWHTVGGAADCKPLIKVTMDEIFKFAKTIPELGAFGFYDCHWHIDIRPRINGEVITWHK